VTNCVATLLMLILLDPVEHPRSKIRSAAAALSSIGLDLASEDLLGDRSYRRAARVPSPRPVSEQP
jgi:hypothetical protein